MTTLAIITLLLTIAGVGVAIFKNKELPESISGLVYDLPKKLQWLWTLWIWAITVTLAFPLMDATKGNTFQFLAFFLIASLGFCGAIPLVAGEKNRAHYALADIAGILSQLCVIIINPEWLKVWAWWIPLSFCIIFFDEKPWWWKIEDVIEGKGMMLVELTAALALYAALLSN